MAHLPNGNGRRVRSEADARTEVKARVGVFKQASTTAPALTAIIVDRAGSAEVDDMSKCTMTHNPTKGSTTA